MHRGDAPLSEVADREIRARVVAELTGAGPLEPYMNDPNVEEIDVNSHLVDLGDLQRRSQGRRRSAVELVRRSDRLPEAARPRMNGTGEGRLDTQSPMLTFQSDDGSRVVMVLGGRHRARHLDPPAHRDPPVRPAPGGPRRAGRTGACSRSRLVPQLAGDDPVRVHGARERSARRRQDDAADRTARRGVAARADHHGREEPARAAPRGRPAAPRRAGAVHPPLQRRRRGRDHDPPARRADPPPQPRPRRGRRAGRGRSARHARRRVDVQAGLAGHDPRPHRRRRDPAARLLRVEVEHEPARVRRVEPDRADRRLRRSTSISSATRSRRRTDPPGHVDHRDRWARRARRSGDHRGVGHRRRRRAGRSSLRCRHVI